MRATKNAEEMTHKHSTMLDKQTKSNVTKNPTIKTWPKVLKITVIWAGIVFAATASAVMIFAALAPVLHLSVAGPSERPEFPDISQESISDDVRNLLLLAKNEYENPQPGEYYASGVKEPWCADFISYLYKEIGHPFQNPHTGGWRIPGVYTLEEYLKSVDAWYSESDYLPQPGDIVIYNGRFFGGHTNLVVKVSEDYFIAVGGNEDNQIRLDEVYWKDERYGVRGFGHVLSQ